MKKLFLILILFCIPFIVNAQNLLTDAVSQTFDTVAATSANDTSRVFNTTTPFHTIYFEFYSSTEWRVAKVDFPMASYYRAVYLTADSSYRVQVKQTETTGDSWVTVPLVFYSTPTIKATVILKTAVSWVRFRYY